MHYLPGCGLPPPLKTSLPIFASPNQSLRSLFESKSFFTALRQTSRPTSSPGRRRRNVTYVFHGGRRRRRRRVGTARLPSPNHRRGGCSFPSKVSLLLCSPSSAEPRLPPPRASGLLLLASFARSRRLQAAEQTCRAGTGSRGKKAAGAAATFLASGRGAGEGPVLSCRSSCCFCSPKQADRSLSPANVGFPVKLELRKEEERKKPSESLAEKGKRATFRPLFRLQQDRPTTGQAAAVAFPPCCCCSLMSSEEAQQRERAHLLASKSALTWAAIPLILACLFCSVIILPCALMALYIQRMLMITRCIFWKTGPCPKEFAVQL